MAKRELSSTLKNLKFMQRGALKEAKKDEQEEEDITVQQASSFGGPSIPIRKCIVVMEGDPCPGAVRGRMSFQSFNPSIDKMNEEAANARQEEVKCSSKDYQNGGIADRSNDSNMRATDNDEYEVEHKRKQPETYFQPSSPHRPEKDEREDGHGQSSSGRSRTGSNKQRKREKLDWNVLRPPKPDARRA